jgi:hypothetical protein
VPCDSSQVILRDLSFIPPKYADKSRIYNLNQAISSTVNGPASTYLVYGALKYQEKIVKGREKEYEKSCNKYY